jgi:hypothetical protein
MARGRKNASEHCARCLERPATIAAVLPVVMSGATLNHRSSGMTSSTVGPRSGTEADRTGDANAGGRWMAVSTVAIWSANGATMLDQAMACSASSCVSGDRMRQVPSGSSRKSFQVNVLARPPSTP